MFCIIIDHAVGWSPSVFSLFTGQGLLFASAGEGFFTISGLLVGYIYREKVTKNVVWVFKKLWKRSLLLYTLTVCFSFIFYFWSKLAPISGFEINQWQGSFHSFVIATLSLSYVYGWHDFLAKYAVFMLFAPFAVWLCSRKKAYIILIISFVVWFFFHAGSFQQFASWQIVFMFSIVLGYHLSSLETFAVRLNKAAKNIPYLILLSLTLATYLLSVFAFTLGPLIFGYILRTSPPVNILDVMNGLIGIRDFYFFPRDDMSIYRLVIGVLWFSALYVFVRKHEKYIEKKTRGFFSLIGRNSLFVFILHGAAIFILYDLIGTQKELNLCLNTIIHATLIAIVYLITRYIDHIKKTSTIKNRLRTGDIL